MKILISDDSVICRKTLAVMLRELGACDQAADGDQAVDNYWQGLQDGDAYPLICLDDQMPGLSGYEARDVIRALETALGRRGPQRTRIIIISADDNPERQATFDPDVEKFLPKPLTREQLLDAIARLVPPSP